MIVQISLNAERTSSTRQLIQNPPKKRSRFAKTSVPLSYLKNYISSESFEIESKWTTSVTDWVYSLSRVSGCSNKTVRELDIFAAACWSTINLRIKLAPARATCWNIFTHQAENGKRKSTQKPKKLIKDGTPPPFSNDTSLHFYTAIAKSERDIHKLDPLSPTRNRVAITTQSTNKHTI